MAGTDLRYDTADNLSVLPINSDASVDALCKAMHNPNENFTIEPINKDFKYPFPVYCQGGSAEILRYSWTAEALFGEQIATVRDI